MLEALEHVGDGGMPPEPARVLLPRAIEIGSAIVTGLKSAGGPGTSAQLAGSLRRQAESVKDLDIVAVSSSPHELTRSLGELPEIESVSSAGTAGARARTHSGMAVDLRIAAPAQAGNLLQHFTGSGATMRRCANRSRLAACTCPSTESLTTRAA